MDRNLDLIRRILQDVKAIPIGQMAGPTYYPDEYPNDIVIEHLKLLHKEGYIEAIIHEERSGLNSIMISRLTSKGHDFLSRNP